ncbi:RNA polymerase sigma factor [Salmonirosea aquatica]|uniref:Sigma-70 family RNA polymerase sigma factor n=1 Tax=Salmonirosea aquatica TaxID=2654236 RepID=A0A7C9BE56_9BACT|nr:sigma-70 family RNA polymerase sigma factor [Cytophagaceae bacterium SJW1-29]
MSIPVQQTILSTVKQYGQKLFGFIRKRVNSHEDAEDILQEVWQQLSSVVNIGEIEQMSGWLHTVARNKIIDRQRKNVPEPLSDSVYESDDGALNFKEILLIDPGSDPEAKYMRELFWQELFTALDELPPAQRDVFVWNEMEDMTLQQIADKTEQNLKTVISRKGYAVKYLRKRLQTLYNELFNY